MQHLDRHRTIHLLVQRPVDDAGTALADARQNAVAAVEKAPQSRIDRSQDDFILAASPGL